MAKRRPGFIYSSSAASDIDHPRLLVNEFDAAAALSVSVGFLRKDRVKPNPIIPMIRLGTLVRYDLPVVMAQLRKTDRPDPDAAPPA